MKAHEQPSQEEAKVTCTHFPSINFDITNSLCRGFVPGIKRTATPCCQLKSVGWMEQILLESIPMAMEGKKMCWGKTEPH